MTKPLYGVVHGLFSLRKPGRERVMRRQQPDTLALPDTDTFVYEAIATLEYTGRRVTRAELAVATNLDAAVVNESLRVLVRSGAVRELGSDDEPAFELASRDWSAAPDRPHGLAAGLAPARPRDDDQAGSG
jgi:hypothetical protein